MTSTHFNIGFGETKNSSRVLKPPGGGHTDIFGINESSDAQTPNKRRNHPPSTINSCFMHEEFSKSNNIEVKETKDIKNGNQNGVKTDVIDENTEPKETNEIKNEKEKNIEEKETTAAPRRGRVPPGGYSSALW